MVEIEHWVSLDSNSTDDISATRTAVSATLHKTNSSDQHITRLLILQTSMEKATVVTMGFNNLKTAFDPLSEEDAKSLLIVLLEELNNLYPLYLCTDITSDRFIEEEIFNESTMDCMDLLLIGASCSHFFQDGGPCHVSKRIKTFLAE
jgi:hypothetical protein